MFSPGRLCIGEDWKSSSFSGGVGLHRKEGVAQRVADFDGVSLIDRGRVRALARYGLRSGSDQIALRATNPTQPGTSNSDQQLGGMAEWIKALVC